MSVDESQRTVRGSCLCGDVRWQTHGPLSMMSHCHCSMCRKAHGAPFATYVGAAADGFELLAGRERIVRHRSSADTVRAFCERCGSVVPDEPSGRMAFMPAGCLDDDPEVRPLAHIFAASKAPWLEIEDDLPRHDAYPPGWDLPTHARAPKPASDPGWVSGGCLCGKVGYELERGSWLAYCCHCSRCRKARAAAHSNNMFVTAEHFRWVSGQDGLLSYKVPEAERFTHVFCATCGSGAPRQVETRVALPAPSLEEDPGIVEQRHIFVGSRASWFTPGGRWPHFEAYAPS